MSADTRVKSERVLVWLLAASIGCGVCLAVAGVFLMTLGFDEAWILEGIQGLVSTQATEVATAPVITSGGAYAVVHIVIQYVAGNTLWAHRAFSLLCLLATGLLIFVWGKRSFGGYTPGLLAVSVFVGTPGTLVFGASAYANLPAILLFLSVAYLWDVLPQRRQRWAVCGTLCGLAASSRPEYVVALPAFIVWALLDWKICRSRLADALVVVIVGGAIAVLAGGGESLGGSGWDWWRAYPQILNKWVLGGQNLSPAMVVLASLVAWFAARRRGFGTDASWTLLVPAGWLLWLAWLAAAPIPHLRYLWPAAAMFAVVLGFGLSWMYNWGCVNELAVARVAALAIALAAVGSGLGFTARSVLHGESNILAWEWSGETALDIFGAFAHLRDQRAAADYARVAIGPTETIGVIDIDRELRYLTGRRFVPLSQFVREHRWNPQTLPRRILISPMVGTYFDLTPQGRVWIEANCRLEAQFGRYSFYTVTGAYPPAAMAFVRYGAYRPVHPLSSPSAGTAAE